MQKRLLALALTLCLALTMIPGAALAAASTLPAAVGGVITLTEDVVLTSRYDVTTDTTIDLNGHKISGGGSFTLIWVKDGATLTLNGTGTVMQVGNENPAIWVGFTDTVSGLNIKPGVTVTSSSPWTISIFKNCVLTSSGTIENTMPINAKKQAGTAIAGNGGDSDTEINITGGSVTSTDGFAIYHPQVGTLNVSGGMIKGKTCGIEMRSGTLNVTGGTIIAERDFVAPEANGSGSTAWGVAIASSQHGTNKAINIKISGGTIKATGTNGKALYAYDVQNPSSGEASTISVTGGEFHGAVGLGDTASDGKGNEQSIAPNLSSGTAITGGKFSEAPDPTLIPANMIAANVGNGTTGAPFTIETNLSQGNLMAYPSVLDFGTAEYGYTKPAYKTLVVEFDASYGYDVSAVLSDDVKDYYEIIPVEETETEDSGAVAYGLDENKTKKFNISPKAGLNAGTYNGNVIVTLSAQNASPSQKPDVVKPQVKFTVAAPSSGSSGSGISLWYNGGNSFGSSRSAVPTSVEIDGTPVSFTGTGSSFTVGCVKSDAKWVTVRWNSTTVTTNFTPDAAARCTSVAIPKTGDMTIAAYAVMAAIAAAGAMLKK